MIPGYRIVRELGRGGMATVYLAVQESLKREVALKILSPALAADAAFAERFLREAHIAGGFRHRHLISVLDAGRVGDDLYLAMEYVPNGTAASLRGGDPGEIRNCLLEIASALGYAHAHGVVHRDLKPENILHREDGSFVLSDFGIARSSEQAHQLTGPQAALGTPAYMSPEQWRNDPIDGRADLYALGIVLHELLMGQPPFQGEDGWSIGLKHMQSARPVLPVAFASWQPVLDRLLAIDPLDRFANARELIAALDGRDPTPVATTPPATPTVQLPIALPRRRLRPHHALLAVLLVLVAFAVQHDWSAPNAIRTAAPGAASTSVALPAKSVAVLPFRVLSERKEDGYFADGLSEEILITLAAIAELKVTGRTSSFAWKDKNADLREIAVALGVAHVLEGSVRRSGDQLRISASLIDARDGSTRWSANFDRDASEAFAVQSEIAKAVADQLAVSIGTRAVPTVARLAPAERDRYLQAVGLSRYQRSSDLPAIRATLRDLIDHHDVGADALLRLFSVDADMMRLSMLPAELGRAEHAELSEMLATRFPGTLEREIAQAYALQSQANLTQELAYFEQALALYRDVLVRAPNDANVAIAAAHTARGMLDFTAAIAFSEQAISSEPEDLRGHWALAVTLGDAGRVEEAMEKTRQIAERWPESPQAHGEYAMVLAASGRIADALIALRDCDRAILVDPCHALHYEWLALLELPEAAAAMTERAGASDPFVRNQVRVRGAVQRGELPDPNWIQPSTAFEAYGAATQEALAQGDAARALDYVQRLYPDDPWASEPGPVVRLTARGAGRMLMLAQLPVAQRYPERVRAHLVAADAELRKVPAASIPYPISGFAVGSALLLGDVDRAIERLEVMSKLSPLAWQRWVISPSGRDMPTAKLLRAHPKFAQIWANREAVISRERARIRQLRPELK